jgi:hypothetical protein
MDSLKTFAGLSQYEVDYLAFLEAKEKNRSHWMKSMKKIQGGVA